MEFQRCHARPTTPITACFQDLLDKSDKNHVRFHGGFIDVAQRLAPDSTHKRIAEEVTMPRNNNLLERIGRIPLVSYGMTAARLRQNVIEEHHNGSISEHHGNHWQYAARKTQPAGANER
jgi:hypothetical protein